MLNRNHSTAKYVALLLCFLTLTYGYTIEGQWQLTQEYVTYTKENPNVAFTFVNNIPQVSLFMPQDTLGGPTITNAFTGTKQLTVHACKTLLYNYYIN